MDKYDYISIVITEANLKGISISGKIKGIVLMSGIIFALSFGIVSADSTSVGSNAVDSLKEHSPGQSKIKFVAGDVGKGIAYVNEEGTVCKAADQKPVKVFGKEWKVPSTARFVTGDIGT